MAYSDIVIQLRNLPEKGNRTVTPLRDHPPDALAWRQSAACRLVDPELFFAEGDPSSPAVIGQAEEARAVCASCAVRSECLAFAYATGQAHGVWGGLTAAERGAADASAPLSLCASGHLAVMGPRGGCPQCQAEARARNGRERESARVRDQSGRKGPLRGHRPGSKGLAA